MSRNKIKDAEKFETYDYGWLMVHDEDMIMYVWEVKFSFKIPWMQESKIKTQEIDSGQI